MTIDNKNQQGYYNEIDYPFQKKNDVKALFSDCEIMEHTNTETEYEYLDFLPNRKI